MIENLIKDIQRFINQPFRYKQLDLFLQNKLDLLLSPAGNQIDKNEFNAMADTIFDMWDWFRHWKEDNWVIGCGDKYTCNISILLIYNTNLKIRNAPR